MPMSEYDGHVTQARRCLDGAEIVRDKRTAEFAVQAAQVHATLAAAAATKELVELLRDTPRTDQAAINTYPSG